MQEKVAIDRQSSKAEGGNKAPLVNKEQADCRSAVVACTHLQAGRGILLMHRMGIALPAAPVSSVSKGAYDAIFAGNLTSSQVEALDKLFLAANTKAGRKLFSDAGLGPRSQQRRRLAS